MNYLESSSVYRHIETFEAVQNTLDCMISELQRGEQDADLKQAIDHLQRAYAILQQYEGKIDESIT